MAYEGLLSLPSMSLFCLKLDQILEHIPNKKTGLGGHHLARNSERVGPATTTISVRKNTSLHNYILRAPFSCPFCPPLFYLLFLVSTMAFTTTAALPESAGTNITITASADDEEVDDGETADEEDDDVEDHREDDTEDDEDYDEVKENGDVDNEEDDETENVATASIVDDGATASEDDDDVEENEEEDTEDDVDDKEYKNDDVDNEEDDVAENVATASAHRHIPTTKKQRKSSVANLYTNGLDPPKYNLLHKAQQPVAANAPGFREALESITIPP
jgi:hypothetical protein